MSDNNEVLLTKKQVKAILKQSKFTGNEARPALKALFKRGEYVYYTDRFTVVRWNLGVLAADILDESYIPFDKNYARQLGGAFKTDFNLDEWSKLADAKKTINLNESTIWSTHATVHFPSVEKIFNTSGARSDDFNSVAFNPIFINNISDILGVLKGEPLKMIKPIAGSPIIKPWKFIRPGYGNSVEALIVPMRYGD